MKDIANENKRCFPTSGLSKTVSGDVELSLLHLVNCGLGKLLGCNINIVVNFFIFIAMCNIDMDYEIGFPHIA